MDADRPVYAAIIADPLVRRFFPETGTPADANAGIDRAMQRLADIGFTYLAVERRSDGAFLGMIGMAPIGKEVRAVLPAHPEVEIGWQLGKEHWGHGYAPEGARAVLDFAWSALALPEVVGITYRGNFPSRRVMEKIGMRYDPKGDFEHPEIPEGHMLRPHVLYRISNPGISSP